MITIQKTITLPDTYPLERLGRREDLLFFDILGSVFWGGGITLSYVSLILWFKIKEKLSKNCG